MTAKYNPAVKMRVQVVSQSPHTFAFQLWHAPAGATKWTFILDGTIETPPTDVGPLPEGTRFLYVLLVSGNPGTDWKVQVLLSQNGTTLTCQPPAERGVIPANTTTAGRETAFVLR